MVMRNLQHRPADRRPFRRPHHVHPIGVRPAEVTPVPAVAAVVGTDPRWHALTAYAEIGFVGPAVTVAASPDVVWVGERR